MYYLEGKTFELYTFRHGLWAPKTQVSLNNTLHKKKHQTYIIYTYIYIYIYIYIYSFI